MAQLLRDTWVCGVDVTYDMCAISVSCMAAGD